MVGGPRSQSIDVGRTLVGFGIRMLSNQKGTNPLAHVYLLPLLTKRIGRPFSRSTNPLAAARFAAVLHRFGQPTPSTGSSRPPLFPSRSSFLRTAPKRNGDTLDLFYCHRRFGAYSGAKCADCGVNGLGVGGSWLWGDGCLGGRWWLNGDEG
ncbi:hypothetical protein V6N11_073428 [Hibiscus sabdariffa]|uniref:Uncharacterized protein n=1 Tax=Hibiscus sabdariffa TaxID=183260 RepID=A0ABR2N9F0_9ROSI